MGIASLKAYRPGGGLAHIRTWFFAQFSDQELAGPMEPGADGANRAPQDFGGLGIVHFLQVAQYHYFPVMKRQGQYCPVNGCDDLAPGESVDRVVPEDERLVQAGIFARLVLRNGIESAIALECPQDSIASHTIHICRDRTFRR